MKTCVLVGITVILFGERVGALLLGDLVGDRVGGLTDLLAGTEVGCLLGGFLALTDAAKKSPLIVATTEIGMISFICKMNGYNAANDIPSRLNSNL